MDEIYEKCIDASDIQKFRQKYAKGVSNKCLTPSMQFDYAWCLVRSSDNGEIKTGIKLLEGLYKTTKDEQEKRDYLYYIAFGYARAREYRKALKFTKGILEFEPNNHQVLDLQSYILKKEKKDVLIGAAVVGGVAAVALGSLVGLGMALTRK